MSKKITLILALAFLVGIALPAFAEVQNVKVSGDITAYGIFRDEYDLNETSGNTTTDNAAFYASIARVRIDADLTDNVQTTIRLLNERPWEGEGDVENDIDLDLAYLTLKEFFYSPLTLTIGRQNLKFGTGLVVGDPDTNAQVAAGGLNNTIAEDLSARKAFDAIRATLDYAPWTIDLIVAKISEVDTTGLGVGSEDEDLLGVNVAYKFGQYNAEAEGYLFVKDSDTEGTSPSASAVPLTQAGDIYTVGLRGGLEPIKGLNLSGEVAYQFGDAYKAPAGGTSRDQKAWALDLDGSYTWDIQYAPSIGLGYSYRSGEEPGNTGDYEAWNPMYEDQTQGIIADYILAGVNGGVNSNANIIKVYGSIKPIKDITLAAKYYNYRLDEKLVSSGTATRAYSAYPSREYTMRDKKDLGDEIDLIATYNYTEDVQIGLSAGWFRPGDAFDNTNDDTATSIIGSVKVVF